MSRYDREDDETEDAADYRKLSARELVILADRGDEDAAAELQRRAEARRGE